MFSKIAVAAIALLSVVDASVINAENGNIPAGSAAAQKLVQSARRVQDNENYGDSSFLVNYNVKFQGCHHVQQWNEDAEDEDDVRIMTKRLVRFRLCPAGECNTELAGCTSHYGDYIVDMETYMGSYYEAMQNMYGAQEGGYDMGDYMECSQFDMRRHLQDNADAYGYYGDEDVDYYLGPYCADQGGEIHLGLFTDDTCTSFAQSQYAISNMPYTQSSMVSTSCISCSAYGDEGYATSEFCDDIYQIAGKCESKMTNVYYPNEAGCSYIEGVKVIREDGVIQSSQSKKSQAATVCIGIFLSLAFLLTGYVYYLRTKLGRAKINLNAASQSLA